MGVNTSKSEVVGKFKSRDSEHVLEIESFDSYPPKSRVAEESTAKDVKIEPEKPEPATENNVVKTNKKSIQKGRTGECWNDNGKIFKVNSSDSDIECDTEGTKDPNNTPLTDAEKRLHQYMKEKGKDIKPIQRKEEIKCPPSRRLKESQDTIATSHGPIRRGTGICIQQNPHASSNQTFGKSPSSPTNKLFSNVVSSQRPKPEAEAVIMSNADILLHRRINQVSPLAIGTDKNKEEPERDDKYKRFPRGLGPVGSKRPGQSEIINQLGEQGIIPPKSETDRTLGELRQIGLIKERPGGTQYTLSIEKPKRQAPKLAPLQSDYVPAHRLPDTPIPQHQQQRSSFDLDKNECCGPLQKPMTPCMEALTDRAWDEEILPLKIEYSGVSDRLRVKMMDFDLL